MASLEELRNERLQKLNKLKQVGLEPYPIQSSVTASCAEVNKNFVSWVKRRRGLRLAGRVLALRRQGAMVFFDFTDGTGRLQGLLKKDEIDEQQRNLFRETVDVGDFVAVAGNLFLTKAKERTILVKNWLMLAKSLRPLPEKWHGLQDIEERFRRRELDSLMSPAVKERFVLRSRLVSAVRAFLDERGFLEVETPVLQPLPGGANALPFVTHHEALNLDLYLRISEELYLKRMLIAGFPKVYSLAKNFRNEGIGNLHNPEFTMLEFYEAFSSAAGQRKLVEQMIKTLARKLLKKTKISYAGKEIDLAKPFGQESYFDLLEKHTGVPNLRGAERDELLVVAGQLKVAVEEVAGREKILDAIYKKVCRPRVIQPTFIVDYPADSLPLAKRKPDMPELVDAFQLIIGGLEIVKAFSELNDPLEQRERFLLQEKERGRGDKEAQRLDEDFLEALEYGMPPAGGVGIGIDRLAMLFTNTQNIKEVIFFPTMRPKKDKDD
jgi:lysyl-tRNA synthetase class 2